MGARKTVIAGNPAFEHVSTSYTERQNLTMRMSIRRFTRLTNAFSKKLENHEAAVALHFMYYNFARIHQTLRCTPAMEAEVTDQYLPPRVIDLPGQPVQYRRPMRKPSVTVRVPATTGNLGPGFDTLGIALKLHNQVSIREADEPAVQLVGATPAKDSPLALAMAREAADAFFSRSKVKKHGIQAEIKGDVPISRGFGSSVTLRLGIVFALNETDGRPLSDAQMLDLLTELEGHSDNCAPALFGGFVVSGRIDGTVRYRRFSVPPQLKFVCCVPEFEVSTEKARVLLPKQVPLRDAVENLNRVALLTAIFASGDFSLLRGLFGDKLHQPYRKKLMPQLDDMIAAGVEAGALGGWLSGSGPGIVCITDQKEKAVAEAMAGIFARDRIRCDTHILHADNDGTRVKRS